MESHPRADNELSSLLSDGLILWRYASAGRNDLWCMVFELPDGYYFVVDDDPAVRSALEHLFRSVGYATQVFASGPEFLERDLASLRGCIILDVRMPGMSGLELQSTLRTRGIDLPVILITGFADVGVVIRAFKAGAFDFIEKPFSDQHLLEVVARAIELDREQYSLQIARAELERRLGAAQVVEHAAGLLRDRRNARR